jgi:hypothetical protein
MKRFNFRSYVIWKSKKSIRFKFQIDVQHLKEMNDDVGINRDWESIRGNVKVSATESLGYYKLKKHELWFDEVFKIIR